MRWLAAFGRFWWDFIVGEDWTVAVAVVAGVGLTAALAHSGHAAWAVLPVVVLATLGLSVWRARAAARRPGA